MALFEYECDCGRKKEVFSTAPRPPMCECGKKMKRKWSGGSLGIKFTFKSGWDEGLGMHIETKKQRDEILREKHLRRITD